MKDAVCCVPCTPGVNTHPHVLYRLSRHYSSCKGPSSGKRWLSLSLSLYIYIYKGNVSTVKQAAHRARFHISGRVIPLRRLATRTSSLFSFTSRQSAPPFPEGPNPISIRRRWPVRHATFVSSINSYVIDSSHITVESISPFWYGTVSVQQYT